MNKFKKLLSVTLAVMMVMSVMPVGAAESAGGTGGGDGTGGSTSLIPTEATPLYSEDFTGYDKGINWLTKTDSDGFVTGITGAEDDIWYIYGTNLGSGDSKIGHVEVVDDPAVGGTRGQVLKIDLNSDNNAYPSSVPTIELTRYLNADHTALTRAEMPEGKKLVISADVYVPGTRNISGSAAPEFLGYRIDSDFGDSYPTVHSALRNTGLRMILNNFTANVTPGRADSSRSLGATDQWATVKKIIDVSAPVSADRPADTARHLYENAEGEVLTAIKTGTDRNNLGTSTTIPAMFKWQSGNTVVDTWHNTFNSGLATFSPFYGLVFGEAYHSDNYSTTKGLSGYYIDNVNAYWIDALKQEGNVVYEEADPEGKWYAGKMEIPFNNEIKSSVTVETFSASAADPKETYDISQLVKLVDASGTVVSGGITSAYLKEGNSKVLVVELKDGFTTGESYKIVADSRFSDVYGQGLGLTGSINDTIDIHEFTVGRNVGVFDVGTPAITDYDIGDDQEVELKFNYPLAEVDLTDVFEVVDENGDPVEGNLNATFNETQDIIKIQLSGLNLKEGKHTIRNKTNTLPTATNANLYAKVRYTFDTIDYTASWSEDSGIQYIEGTDKTVTVTLSTPTVLDQTNIDTAFEVEDVSGNVVNGLVADIDASGKEITLQLSGLNLELGKYYIKSTSALTDRRGRTLNTSYMIRSVAEISNVTLLFEEDFETGYTLNENWITADSTDDAYQVPASEGGTWTIKYANGGRTYTESNPNPNVIQVVDGTNKVDSDGQLVGLSGNVLQLTAGFTSGSSSALTLRRDVPGGSIDFNDSESPYYKKQLIYEFDFFVEKSSGTQNTFMAYNEERVNTLYGTSSYFTNGTYASSSTQSVDLKNWYAEYYTRTPKKHHMKVIVDPSGDVDSTRYFLDGNVVTAAFNLAIDDSYSNYGKMAKDFVGPGYTGQSVRALAPFEGITTKSYTEVSGNKGTYYIDNFKAYIVEAIECTGFEVDADNPVDAFNPGKGFTLKFSDKIDAQELKANLVIKDDNGAAVNNAIRLVTVSEDGESALVKLDFTKLEANKHYTVSLGEDFYSKDGAIFANQFKGVIEVFDFTTCDKFDVTISPSLITDYDQGVSKTVTITLSRPLRDGVEPADAFIVTDCNENEVEGLSATISEDRKIITLQLSGIQLGDGQHYISSRDEYFAEEDGSTVINIVVKTLDFKLEKVDPVSGIIKDYVEGTEKKIKFVLTATTTLAADDIATGFEVVDKNGNIVSGLNATLFADNKTIQLDLSGLNVGVGEHTIKSSPKLVDARGRQLALDYKFTVLPFTASYDAEVTGYEPGTDKTVEINLTYPLNDASANSINNSFIVKNEAGLKSTGLKATMSEDKKVIKLALKDLEIVGGIYTITSKAGTLVDSKGETLAENISFKLITATAGGSIGGTTSGQAPGTGTPSHPDFSKVVLMDESFDSYSEIMGSDWITNAEAIPNKFQLSIVGERFSDASVSIEEDPANPGSGNMVLKNVAGFYGMAGNVLAGNTATPANYHVVQRNLEDGSKATIPTDEHTIVRVSTKVYIPQESINSIPTASSNTRNANYIFAAIGSADYTPITPANFAKTTASALFHSQISAANSVDPTTPKNQIIKRVFTADTWHTIEFIFGVNPRKDGTTFASYEVLIDGTSVDNEIGKYFAATYSTIGGMVSKIIAASAGNGPVTVYYDDWKITQETRFATHVNVPVANVPENQVIELTLTKDLDSASMQLIKDQGLATLTDENGNKVEATITYSGNNKITITPKYGLAYQTKYVVQIASEANVNGAKYAIKAADGEAFGGLTYAFETAKALSTYIDSDASTFACNAEYLNDATSFTYNMQLSEPALTDIIAAVATFNGKDELLSIKYETILQGQQTKNFELTSPAGAKSFKIYIWEQNGDGSMGNLMQFPDEITSR